MPSLATWNINSVRLRLPLVLRFLRTHPVDVLCLQEIKCLNEQFPAKKLAKAGDPYQAVHGQKGYHGVAIVSRHPLTDISSRVFCEIADCRHVSATLDFGRGPLTVHSIYIPAGGDIPDPDVNPKFRHKLDFLKELKAWFGEAHFKERQLICGDFNVAPHPDDVWSHKQLLKVVSHTPVETEALDDLLTANHGWTDLVRKHHPFTTNGLMLRHRLFEEVALHPLVRTVAESAVGQGMLLGAMSATYKEAGPGLIDIHADYPLVRDPYPEFGLIAVACWALDDWTIDAGPTWVIPGSHRRRRAPKRGDSRDGAVPIEMPKGSVALWANGVWHWQGERRLPGARVAIHVTYNRVFVRQLDDFSGVTQEMYARNPPAFSTLMGQDDPFGKSSFRGHDGKRFAYAARTLNT